MAGMKSLSPRAIFNRAISARVDAQMDWRVSGLKESHAALQRLVTEMSTTISSRLIVLEKAVLADLSDTHSDGDDPTSSTSS